MWKYLRKIPGNSLLRTRRERWLTAALKNQSAELRAKHLIPEAELLSWLISSDPGAKKVFNWMVSHLIQKSIKLVDDKCFAYLAHYLTKPRPATEWDLLPDQKRQRHCERVSKLANELAGLMDRDSAPNYPPAYNLFDGYSEPKRRLEDLFGERFETRVRAQSLPPILRRLAEHAEQIAQEPKPDARPNTKNPEARVLAKNLAKFFLYAFDKQPYEIVSILVNHQYPKIYPLPGPEDVRGWIKTK